MNRKYWVYVHTCPNGKKYVGATTEYYPTVRWDCGRGYKGQPFYQAIQEFGWNNISHETKEMSNREEMWKEEERLIKLYETTNPEKGYNVATGKTCQGVKRSSETRKKLSEIKKGKEHPMLEKTKLKLSLIHKGKPLTRYPYLFPDGTIKYLCSHIATQCYISKGIQLTKIEEGPSF